MHFIGSDSHREDEKQQGASEVYAILCKHYDNETVSRLFWDNPMTLLMNKKDNMTRQGAV